MRILPRVLLLALFGVCRPGAAQETAAHLLVHLEADDATTDTRTWRDRAGGPAFARLGAPRVETVAGVPAMVFDGRHDAFQGPPAPEALTGGRPRSVEAWVCNPAVDAAEETLVAWGRRSEVPGANFSFNYGSSSDFGAATHWGLDIGWQGVPAPGQWHHLVYTYDGRRAAVYDNTALRGERNVRLDTSAGQFLRIGVQNGADGRPAFLNPLNGSPLAGSLAIASVRIHAAALTPAQIEAAFEGRAARFHAAKQKTLADRLTETVSIESDDLVLRLLPDTLSVAAFSPRGQDFDFTPGDRLAQRQGSRFHHLGDVSLRTRTGDGPWADWDSATSPGSVRRLPGTLLAADLTAALGPGCPLAVERRWEVVEGCTTLRFRVRNSTDAPVELGALGAAMVFNNLFTGRRLAETHTRCSFTDPSIAGDAGYVQVTRVNGQGPVLLVLPEKGTSLEAWRALRSDPTPLGVTFEGFYDWTVHSRAWAETEWKKILPWNAPTSRVLQPGEEAVYGFRFILAPSIRAIESTLVAQGRPVAVGIPGYMLHAGETARLFLHSADAVTSMSLEPAGGLEITPDAQPTSGGWRGYTLRPRALGRLRLTVAYSGGGRQSIHYNLLASQSEQVARVAAFHQTRQWYVDPQDPFRRTFSYMGWDRETDTMLMQDSRVWNAGLSDECGAGPNLLMAMKNGLLPDAAQVRHLEQYVDHALWGNLQNRSDYGVHASLFYYEPQALPPGTYTIRGGWDKARSETTWRAYNYPHQAAVYWNLYRLARNTRGLVQAHPWDWYLRQAFRTALALRDHCGRGAFLHLSQFGLMDGTVFLDILDDLRREGWTAEADTLEAYMKTRADIWNSLEYPFGSEMPWDSTGQEEVYLWCRHFGREDKARTALDAISAYTPALPHWAYNGSSRRYFDSMVYGKVGRILRQGPHYGASLNAIPSLDAFRARPDDFHLLRIGYAGANGVLGNIDERGRSSMTFLADAEFLDYEPFSGDYGSAFFGYARNAGAYAVRHPEFGWLGFGCDIVPAGGILNITPRDAFRRRVYLAPLGLYLTLDSGRFRRIELDGDLKRVRAVLDPATPVELQALLRVQTPVSPGAFPAFRPVPAPPLVRGAYEIALKDGESTVILAFDAEPGEVPGAAAR